MRKHDINNRLRFATVVVLLAGTLQLTGCATNPVTGEEELSLIPESQELAIGRQQYAPARQAQGGDYVADPAVAAYVNEVGQRLARVSDRKLPYEFHVLNSSVPNAWAMPGGKIAINRGLLTEMQSEAELAAVLGHEIVHAAAKHTVQGIQRGLLLQGAVMAATVASRNSDYANLASLGSSIGAQVINQKYGRDAEREADTFGMQYMARAGYDPRGAVDLQRTFVKLSEDRRQDWLSGLFSSHPPSQERVDNNLALLAKLPPGGEQGRDRYRQRMARLHRTKPAYEAYDDAREALAKGDSDRARTLVRKAIDIEPREGHFFSLLGDIDRKAGRHRSASEHYDRAIGLNDGFFYYYLQRGLVRRELAARGGAEQDLKRSIDLLPTANAYKALGDLARDDNRLAEAKQHYAQAAKHDSDAGRSAYAALVDLDLPGNPGQYLRVRTGRSGNGQLLVEIANTTPRDVADIAIVVQFRDANGRLRELQQRLRGVLPAGQRQVFDLGVTVSASQSRLSRAAVVDARIAR